jgi:xanthine dehydrogenase D subunit
MTATSRAQAQDAAGGVGQSVPRPDGIPKLTGAFEYSSDLHHEDMLWGATLRSPHPRALIAGIDTAPARDGPGVQAVLIASDVPGNPRFGQVDTDQPVLAIDEVSFWGQPVALVAATDPASAKAAAAKINISYEPLDPLIDPEEAEKQGHTFRTMDVINGDQSLRGSVAVEGYYETGIQDQAMLGTESGLAVPDGEGGVDLYISTQWLHVDHRQIVDCLGLRPEQVRLHIAGIGGAFGAREDLTLQVHLCMLALHTGRPVKMIYDRRESFAGHVHRHPARMWYRHEAEPDGTLVRVEARILLDGGAFAETSSAVLANSANFAVGPYRCQSVQIHGAAVRTNLPPAGAMRGFGANQVCFAYEAQMDRLAHALGMDPIDLRLHNALGPGDSMPTTGQPITGSLPTAEVIRAVAAMPLPASIPSEDPRWLPGGTGLTTPPELVRRGTGFAVGIKNIAFSEAFDDYAEARAVLTGEGIELHTAAAEVGQGMITVLEQIARSASGVGNVRVIFDHTGEIGSAGSTSASRQTQMAGGAALAACLAVREEALRRVRGDDLTDQGVWKGGKRVATLQEVLAEGPVESHQQFRHPPTEAPNETGQGNVHAGFAVAAQRAVVDVDPELGLVRVVHVDTAQDVGKAINPQAVLGQIEGGILQGVGQAIMEELLVDGGVVVNPSFTDYLIPTTLDAPDVEAVLVEEPEPWGPFGAKGFAELPTIAATPAVVAAIRAATGRELARVPVRPEDIIDL